MSTPFRRFFATALRPEIIRRGCVTALVVGTLLAGINHGFEILALNIDFARLCRIGLTFMVPYCVSTYAATMQELRHQAAAESRAMNGLVRAN